MIVPVRCFTCGKVLADKSEAYAIMCQKANDAASQDTNTDKDMDGNTGVAVKTVQGRALDALGITNLCCRSNMLSFVDLSGQL